MQGPPPATPPSPTSRRSPSVPASQFPVRARYGETDPMSLSARPEDSDGNPVRLGELNLA